MENHVPHCMARAYACRTHGKPYVWHMASHVSSCMALLEPIYRGVPIQLMGAQIECVGGAARRRRRKGKEKGRRGKEKGGKGEREERKEESKGEREEKKRKGKKKREEERGGKEEKERGKGRSVAQ